MMLTIGSLFSGVGGLDLGFERTGKFKVVWQCEVNEYAGSILGSHWSAVPNLGDIRLVDWRAVERPDILCGGFPCQDLSVAGKGRGIKEGTRSGLWFEYAKAIRELRPKYVVVENVPMLIRRGINIVLADLSEAGYDAVWTDLRASDAGALHRRERIFIVATRQAGSPSDRDGERRDDRGDAQGIRAVEERQLGSEDEEERRLLAAAAERAHAFDEHLESSFRRFPEFEWCRGIGRIEDLFGRESIPEPILRGDFDGTSVGLDAKTRVERVRCVGNAVVPACAQIIAEYILKLEGELDGNLP